MYKQLIIDEAKKQGITYVPQLAYILATVHWETNATFKPVVEAYWLSEDWRRKNLRYYPYHGRGFVQITWGYNYKKFSDILGKDLVKNPDLALDPEISAFIAVYGMIHGTFTGKRLSDYINSDTINYFSARRIINGTDRAKEIAALASKYESELSENKVVGVDRVAFAKALQSLLNDYGASLVVDGDFGPKSRAALDKVLNG